MSFTIYIILIVIIPLILLMNGNRLKSKPKLQEFVIVGSILLAIFLAFFASRVYVFEKNEGEYTYHTKVYLWKSIYTSDDGSEIEITPSYFRCGVLNLTNQHLKLVPKQYGRNRKANLNKYNIPEYSYVATKEWNVDVFPPKGAPSSVRGKTKNKTIYILKFGELILYKGQLF